MSKPSKSKKEKVPKITEEEYKAYLSALKSSSEQQPLTVENQTVERGNLNIEN